jgi:V/A-type H+-transporting ATPase subunit A
MGVVTRVNGPLVEVTGLDDASMLEVVEVGPRRLPAETVAIESGVATLQAYEYTGGLRVGDPAVAAGGPLSARLGPHLLGQVFDGLLRPLSQAPVWLTAEPWEAARDERRWAFAPCAQLEETTVPGRLLGVVEGDAGAIEHRVLVPPAVRGRLEWLAPAGLLTADEAVARISGHEVRLSELWPVRHPRPYAERVEDVEPLVTGQRVIDLLFPLARGGVAGVPGGFGTGKTVLLQQLAKWCDADVIVYVGCGERGNEMADVLAELAELADPRTGGRLLDRSVIIANTSNMPMMAREASIYTGITVAEYYRDMGYDAVVIADSTSRWAEALREFASRTGSLPAEEGYPAELPSALAAFYGRAGRMRTLGGQLGSVTIVGAVSPPGGDLTEPVTTTTMRFVRSVWSLDRDLAYSRHYPAVGWSQSFCRDAEAIGTWHAARGDDTWVTRRARTLALLAEANRLAALAELLGEGALPGHERMVILAARLVREAVLRQSALSPNDAYCSPEKGAALLDMALEVSEALQRLIEHEVPATTLEALDLGAAVRAAEETEPNDMTAVAARREEILRRLGEVR